MPDRLREILDELERPLAQDRVRERYALVLEALGIVDRDENPGGWAWLQVLAGQLAALGVSLEEAPAAFAAAIDHYHCALTVYTAEQYPDDFAWVHHGLGMIYQVPVHGDEAENAERAIDHFSQAAAALRNRDPARFAAEQASLARTLLTRPRGDPVQNVASATEQAQLGLSVLREGDDPELWADLHHVLGDALFANWTGGSPADAELAVAHYEAALAVWGDAPSPEAADLQVRVGILYPERSTGDSVANHETALAYLRKALLGFSDDQVRWRMAALVFVGYLVARPAEPRSADVEEALELIAALEPLIPVDDTHSIALLESARGDAYLQRVSGDTGGDRDTAIGAYGRVLEIREAAGDAHGVALTHLRLGNAFADHPTGSRADHMEAAIQHYTIALEGLSPADDPRHWAQAQNNLADAYRNRVRGDRAADLDRAIECLEAALTVYSPETSSAEWALAHKNLAVVLWKRIRGSRAENLERAIAHAEKALSAFDAERFAGRRADTENDLGSIYMQRIRGDPGENVELALEWYGRGLARREAAGLEREAAWSRGNLGLAYLDRRRGDRRENLETGVELIAGTLDVIDRDGDPVGWAGLQHNLAAAYTDRLGGNRAQNIEEAIRRAHLALEVRTRDELPEQWAETQDTLAIAFTARLLGDAADNAEQAIAAYRRALTVFTREDHPRDHARVNGNLALVLRLRVHGDRSASIEEAIRAAATALESTPRDELPDEWARHNNTLATCYSVRIEGDPDENVNMTIRCLERALEVRTRSRSPVLWAMTKSNLGGAYVERADLGGGLTDADAGLEHISAALEVETGEADVRRWTQLQTVLAQAHSARDRHGAPGAADDAAHHYTLALEALPVDVFPADHLRVAGMLGNLHFSRKAWGPAHAAFDDAVVAVDRLVEAAHTETGRRELVEQTARLFANDAFCLIRLDRLAEALVRLERGKTRLLAETLALREADAAALPEAEAAELQAARAAVRALDAEMREPPDTPGVRSPAELGALLGAARAELASVVKDIRRNRPDFMPMGLEVQEILAAVPPRGALAAPLVTSQGGAILIISDGVREVEAEHLVDLPELDADWLSAFLIGTDDAPGWLNVYLAARTQPEFVGNWRSTLVEATRALWVAVVGPAVERLERLEVERDSHVVLVPQGGLALLPLHAAWRESEGRPVALIDDYVVSYAPSVFALTVSRRRAAEPQRSGRRLLSVVDPTEDLRYAAEEGEAVAALFAPGDRRILQGAAATEDAVAAATSDCSHLHFACHGRYDWKNPSDSALILAEENPLTVAELLSDRVDLSSARLVVLSACETGMTEFDRSPDEYVGLPAGFLAAGAPAVLCTLWAVDDMSAAMLMERFHECLVGDGMVAEEALRAAQSWIRELDYRQLLERLAGAPPTARARATDALQSSPGVAPQLDDHPFAEPYHWAAFALTGA